MTEDTGAETRAQQIRKQVERNLGGRFSESDAQVVEEVVAEIIQEAEAGSSIFVPPGKVGVVVDEGEDGAAQFNDDAVERAAREAFWTDDIGGHHKPGPIPHTWENIPEAGRENYRTLVRAALRAALTEEGGAD